ncbi:ferredoxin [Prosthecochloris aestuarii DSM 271]|uniref:Ferredoxin n=2 Tax=Prosthecochloris aestuarii TaxID=1102 RepID=B4S6X5_PROA2|nr:ferredoxin [Prosthecochloris aestuarii DSM 271]
MTMSQSPDIGAHVSTLMKPFLACPAKTGQKKTDLRNFHKATRVIDYCYSSESEQKNIIMKININNRSYEAVVGERLIDVARKNHTHIGYFCGGNGLCQTCYVRVNKGMDLLSPLSDREKALLSDTLIKEGTRVACLTTLDKPGTLELLTTVEEVKRMVESRPQDIVAYQAKMGWEALIKFPDTVTMQARRFAEGKLDTWELVTDVITAIGDAIALTVRTLQHGWDPSEPGKTFKRQYAHEHNLEQNAIEQASLTKKEPAEKQNLPEALRIDQKAPVN